MFPKQQYIKAMKTNQSMHKQKGFLIPLAVFILVVMSMFALTVSRSTVQATSSTSLELMTLQAFYAAESGSYRGMQTLFFPDPSSRMDVDTRCINLNATHNFVITGLKMCSAVVTCACVYTDTSSCSPGTPANYLPSTPYGQLTSFYKLTSVATCGSGNFRSVRTVETGAMMSQGAVP